MKQPKHFFNLESSPNKMGEHLIFFNLSYGFKEYNPKTRKNKYVPIRLSTEYRIQKEYWIDTPTYRANQQYVRRIGKNLNNVLEKIESTSYKQLELFRETHEKDPSPSELKNLILVKLKRIKKPNTDVLITDYIKDTVTTRTTVGIKSSKRWSKGTGKQYTNLKNHIENYEVKTNQTLTFGTITGEIFMDFFKTINDHQKELTNEFFAHNTIAKQNKHFRAILKAANKSKIVVGFSHSSDEYEIKEIHIKNEIVLSTEHLHAIINSDVSYSKELSHARNYIILSSFTGLRIGDMIFLHELEPKNQKYNSLSYYCITTRIRKNKENKEELTTVIPILAPIKNYLTENESKFPEFPAQTNIRKYITKLLKHLEIENLVDVKKYYYLIDNPIVSKEKLCDVFTPHDCRSTFITKLKELGIADSDIEPITHPKLKSGSIIQTYDKSKLIQKAVNLINILNTKNSELYNYIE
jgi:hypothetical protein